MKVITACVLGLQVALATLHAGAAGLARAQAVPAGSAPQSAAFDIPPQSLSAALNSFSAATGIEILVDARQAVAHRSSGVVGVMAPQDALEILLIGSGLVARRFDAGTVLLLPSSARGTARSPTSSQDVKQFYFGHVQRAIHKTLCANAETAPGHYRLAVKLWVGQSGRVLRVRRLDTTGDEKRDAALDAAIQGVIIAPPPDDLPQPITLVVAPRQDAHEEGCSPLMPELRRASSH
ncbi:MAG TPA: TonB C-terminal domain-containing protein [Bradyrhizobium sp.]|nr:TonB C-terminal domain-containing protein [Bradyrhizobium sp.]